MIAKKTPTEKTTRKIYAKTDSYLVYCQGINLGFDLAANANVNPEAISPVADRLTKIRLITDNYKWPFGQYLDQSASILVAAVSNQIEVAIQSAMDLEKKVLKTRDLLARLRYALVIFSLFCLVGLAFYFLVASSNYQLSQLLQDEMKLLLGCILFGGIGGFVSIVSRINTFDIDIYSPWSLLSFTGLLRFTLAMVCGMVVFFIMKGEIISFIGDPNNVHAYFIISCVAGFSEHFIPGTLEKIGGKTKLNVGSGKN